MKPDEAKRVYTPGGGLQEALYSWLCPNLMINMYPDNVSANLILPIFQERH
jgi:choline monooxygenase